MDFFAKSIFRSYFEGFRFYLPPIPNTCIEHLPFNAPRYARVVFQGACKEISFTVHCLF
jgi:hypothetical protein